MAVTDPDAPKHQRATMLLVPTDTPGFNMVRPLSNMGHVEGPGHWEIAYEDCRVPADAGHARRAPAAASRSRRTGSGPGRIHHCMRLIGVAERALELMCERAKSREMFGTALADRQFIQDFIATSRAEIDQARLVTQHAAWKLDKVGNRAAREELSVTKLVVPTMALNVVDRAIQVFGGAGVSDDTPLSWMYRYNRMLRIGDGADEVHKQVIARFELREGARTPRPPSPWRRREPYETLLVTRPRDGVVLVTLDRPDRLQRDHVPDVRRAARPVRRAAWPTRDARAVVITGAGRGFCRGLDLDEAMTLPDMTPARDDARPAALGRRVREDPRAARSR